MPNSPHKTEISEVPGSPGFPSPGPGGQALQPLSWGQAKEGEGVPIGGAELPADVPSPIEMPGSTHMDEHHPAFSSLSQVHNVPRRDEEGNEYDDDDGDGSRDRKRETLNSMHLSELDSPIYSPIGGSALLPDSPHLRGAHVRGVVQDLERSNSRRTAETGVSAVEGGGSRTGTPASMRSARSNRVSKEV